MDNNDVPSLTDLIHEVLDKGYLMSLATSDEGGVWVADVIYIYDEDLQLYWVSDPAVRHSQALEKGPMVAVSITASSQGEPNLGLQLAGQAKKLAGSRPDLAKKHWAKRKKSEPIPIDWLDSDRWYELKPTKIELIHEKHFGFEKRVLSL